MSQALPAPIVCPHCRAENLPQAAKCWLCHAPLRDDRNVVMAELATKARPLPLTDAFFWFLIIACLGLMVVVGVGIAQSGAGLLIPYAILITPALLATLGRSLKSVQRGDQVSGKQALATLMLSASVTLLVVAALLVAAVAALFVVCLYVIGTGKV